MVVVPGNFIYVATPRTASRSTTAILSKLPEAVVDNIHHTPLDRVVAAQQQHGLPIYTLTRETASQLLSFWWLIHRSRGQNEFKDDFAKYIAEGQPLAPRLRLSRDHALNIYADIVSEVWCYEDGLEQILEHWGVTEDLYGEMPSVGMAAAGARPPLSMITNEHRALVREHYPHDVEFYNFVSNS